MSFQPLCCQYFSNISLKMLLQFNAKSNSSPVFLSLMKASWYELGYSIWNPYSPVQDSPQNFNKGVCFSDGLPFWAASFKDHTPSVQHFGPICPKGTSHFFFLFVDVSCKLANPIEINTHCVKGIWWIFPRGRMNYRLAGHALIQLNPITITPGSCNAPPDFIFRTDCKIS